MVAHLALAVDAHVQAAGPAARAVLGLGSQHLHDGARPDVHVVLDILVVLIFVHILVFIVVAVSRVVAQLEDLDRVTKLIK